MKDFNWIDLLRRLPTSLLIILAIDWILLKDLIELYKFQVDSSDPNKMYVLIAIFVIVAVNLVIMSIFARVRYLYEKVKFPSDNSQTI